MRISDWSSDVCSSDLASTATHTIMCWNSRMGSSSRCGNISTHTMSGKSLAKMFMMSLSRRTGVSSGNGDLDAAPGQHLAGLSCNTRSEEHTSELQSLMRISYAVFCLKKKKQISN